MNKAPIIYLAPFQGITTYVFREVYAAHFPYVDKFFTPFFTNVYRHKSIDKKGQELASTHHNKIPVVPQVLSKDAAEISKFGVYCEELGFEEINWNLGCPFSRVALKKRGSGMLPYPELVADILHEVIPTLPVKLSVKCRLGYHSPEEIFKLLDIFREYNISELIIHARIGKQIYSGIADHASFERVIQTTNLPLVYNGDVFTVDDNHKLSARFLSINQWMIGRGLLVDPFLPGDIKGSALDEDRTHHIRRFVDDLYYAYRKGKNDSLHAISVMKELWEYLSFSFDSPEKVFSQVKKAKSFDDYEDGVNRVFDKFTWLGSKSRQFVSSSI